MKIYCTAILYLLFATTTSMAQSNLDSLYNELAKAQGTQKIDVLNELAYQVSYDSAQAAIGYAEQALKQSQTLKYNKGKHDAQLNLGEAHYFLQQFDKAIEYWSQALASARELKNDTLVAKRLGNIAMGFANIGQLDTAVALYQQSFDVAGAIKLSKHQNECLYYLAMLTRMQGKYDQSVAFCFDMAEISRDLGDKSGEATAFSMMGLAFKTSGDYKEAINNYQKALSIQEAIADTAGMAQTLSNIGNIYFYFGENFEARYQTAADNYRRASDMFHRLGDVLSEAIINNSLGLIYTGQKSFDTAHIFFDKTLALLANKNDADSEKEKAKALNHKGLIFLQTNYLNEALQYCSQALSVLQKIPNAKNEVTVVLNDLGKIYSALGRYDLATQYMQQSVQYAVELGLRKELSDIYRDLSEVYEKSGNATAALLYFKKHSSLRDSVLNDQNLKQINEMEARFENEKKQKEIALLTKDRELQSQTIRNQNYVTWGLILGLLMIGVIGVVTYLRYKEKRRLSEQLAQQNDEITRHRDQIFAQKEHITNSIQYARRIQTAVMQTDAAMSKILQQYFILYKPRDIVSGDFYWAIQNGSRTIFTVADCTGHGVPGAFMSMLGISFLNQIVNQNNQLSAAEVLNLLRDNIIASLRQSDQENTQKDGMDIAFCIFDQQTNILQFAGANNSLIVVRDGELTELEPDKMPIGYFFRNMHPFKNIEWQVKKNDVLYLYTDGYVDQVGGKEGRKFMTKRFKQFLCDIYTLPMPEQHIKLNAAIETWKGEEQQVDDILVMGVRM